SASLARVFCWELRKSGLDICPIRAAGNIPSQDPIDEQCYAADLHAGLCGKSPPAHDTDSRDNPLILRTFERRCTDGRRRVGVDEARERPFDPAHIALRGLTLA